MKRFNSYEVIGALALDGPGMGGRRMLKAAAALVALGYCSLLVYQGGVALNFQETSVGVPVPNLSIEPVTKTSISDSGQKKNITLDDVFISVKTTKHYQYTRLPVILKTWYQLAKQQVRIIFFINL